MNVYPNALIPADWDETETDSLKYINERERIKVSTHNPEIFSFTFATLVSTPPTQFNGTYTEEGLIEILSHDGKHLP